MRIMVRHANSDFDAMITANGMEEAGASVFSITHDGMYRPFGAMAPSSRFVVWAKVNSDADIDAVDDAIRRELSKYTAQ